MANDCWSPLWVLCRKESRPEATRVLVPCGRCVWCLARRASAWSFRLREEERVAKSAYFVTLTYDSDNVPITDNGFLSLSAPTERYKYCDIATKKERVKTGDHSNDLELFFKRLRKAHFGNSGGDIKYYAVGEYGGKLGRPHYHIILFNADLSKMFDRHTVCALKTFGLNGKRLVYSDIWDKGHITVGQVNGASVGYTLKYISEPYICNEGDKDDRVKPYSRMSKGLGLSYLEDRSRVNWHFEDMANRMYVNIEGGKKATMPRYFKERLYYDDEREQISDAGRQRYADSVIEMCMGKSEEDVDKMKRERYARRFEFQKKFNNLVHKSDYGLSFRGYLVGRRSYSGSSREEEELFLSVS